MISYYELLKRIEKGDIPEKIKVHLTPGTSKLYVRESDIDDTFCYVIDEDEETSEDYHYYLAECFLESDMFEKNIEIIEEEKKIPEKLKHEDFLDNFGGLAINDDKFIDKINEILDYLKSKGE